VLDSRIYGKQQKRQSPGNFIFFCPQVTGDRHLLCSISHKGLASIAGPGKQTQQAPPSPHMRMEADQVSGSLSLLAILNSGQGMKVQKYSNSKFGNHFNQEHKNDSHDYTNFLYNK
jgi:hypothetical protein